MADIRMSTVAEAARDEKDIFEITSEDEFAASFPPSPTPPAPSEPLIATASKGNEKDEPGESSFSKWWSSDATQEKVQGVLGSLQATFTGMAGIPLGGGDMSSMERAGVRAARAPGIARQRIREKQFMRYIDQEIAKEEDPRRKLMLQSMRQDPEHAAQYFTSESPSSKQARALELAKVKHDYKELEIKLRGSYEGGVTPNRKDDILTISKMFDLLPDDEKKALRETGEIPDTWWGNTGAIALMPKLFSPSGGILGGGGFAIEMPTFSGTIEVDDGLGGTETVGAYEAWTRMVDRHWDKLPESVRNWWDLVFKKHELEASEEADAVRKDLELE